jgi:hypothetical protein
VKAVWKFLAIFLGTVVGTCLFLTVVIFVTGDPLRDWLSSSLGIFFPNQGLNVDLPTREVVTAMIERGVVVTPDGLIGSIANLYGNMIQVLVGVFAAFAILSFFAIRWQSIQQAEAFVESKVEKSLSSADFKRQIDESTLKTFDTYSVSIQESLENYSNIEQRLIALEQI